MAVYNCKLATNKCNLSQRMLLVGTLQMASVERKVICVPIKTIDVSLKSLVAADKSVGMTY